jgi:sulfur transfer protein SufE
MNEILEKVKNLDIQQLTSLKEEIDKFIKEKQNDDKTYVFEASLEGNTYRGAVYVAKLELKDGKINREFKKLTRTFIDKYLEKHMM